MAINTTNNKVYFKRGTQTNFDALSSFVAGSFYLTDAGRLYYANGTAKADVLLLSSNIHAIKEDNKEIDSTAKIKNIIGTDNLITGDYYYLIDHNVLLYYDGNTFKQINPDTTLISTTSAMSVTAGSTANTAEVTTEIKDSRNNTAQGLFTIKGGTNIEIVPDPTKKEILISNTLVNTNTTYTFSSTAVSATKVQVVLKDNTTNTNDKQAVSIVGKDGVVVSQTKSNEIVISGVPTISSIVHSVTNNGAFETKIQQGTATFASEPFLPIVNYGATKNGNTISYSSSAVFTDNANTDSAESALNLDVYNREQVDALIENAKSTLDAMTYKGSLTAADAAAGGKLAQITSSTTPTSNARGDTYKAKENIDYVNGSTEIHLKKGDLLIFYGEDGARGVYNSSATSGNNLEIVESGDDQLVYLEGTNGSNVINFKDHITEASGAGLIGSITFTNTKSTTKNADINISTTVNATNSGVIAVNIAHGAPGAGTTISGAAATATNVSPINPEEGSELVITGIESFARDAQGHITTATFQKYKIKDTIPIIQATDIIVDNSGNNKELTFGYSLNGGGLTNNASHMIYFNSETLNFTASTSATNANIGGYNVELTWGSF